MLISPVKNKSNKSVDTMDNKAIKILVVDDEPDIVEILQYNLEKEGYSVTSAYNGKDAVKEAKELQPHLIILDIMMPDMDGIETCREIRSISRLQDSMIAFLTARNEDYSQIAGFDVGADDYIKKPVKPRVLTSRVKGLLRRLTHEGAGPTLQVGDLVINKDEYLVYKNEEQITMARKEFGILLLLAEKPGRVYSRDEILENIWDDNIIVGDRTIDVHIRKLREKLGKEYIKTVKGVGYKLEK